jgi:diguanylate cyclase (GGDEF)-like protein
MLTPYVQLATTLLDSVTGVCLLDAQYKVTARSGTMDEKFVIRGITAKWLTAGKRAPLYLGLVTECVIAVALEKSNGDLLGVFCVKQASSAVTPPHEAHARNVAARLKPVLDCLHRELLAAAPSQARVKALTERTTELEWLFELTGHLKSGVDDREVVKELLRAATERLRSSLGILLVPDRRLALEYICDGVQGTGLKPVAAGLRKHLLAWAQRQDRPLVINGKSASTRIAARCKLLSVPMVREEGRVIGVMAFFKSCDAADFGRSQVFLARHLGRQAASLVDAQFDLMTGLYTRGGLEQIYARDRDEAPVRAGSVIYIDIDRMRVVNELHGFELGNEVIVRVAELVGAASTADGALAARVSGDRFALILPQSETSAAMDIAAGLQEAAARLVIGPPQGPVEVSLSCGVAALVPMPQGLARAIAAAEVACKKAKERGRSRTEIYACDDRSMMRMQDDAVAVGSLRAAIRDDRLLLYAQRIASLHDASLPGGYELLLRLREPGGEITPPGALVTAAQRYQLLPTIDRWVVKRALEMLSPYRSMLSSRGISMSINVSGQSIADEEFVQSFVEQLQAAHLPGGCVTVEITEQAAITNLPRANEMIRKLGALGCRLALDDFGTGANSLVSLKSLQIARVKIDGGFVRDIVTDQRSQATVKAIVELAKGYGIDTVAEYVENRAIADAVRRLGVDYGQGYAFGKPEPLDRLLADLTRDESRRLHKLFLEM